MSRLFELLHRTVALAEDSSGILSTVRTAANGAERNGAEILSDPGYGTSKPAGDLQDISVEFVNVTKETRIIVHTEPNSPATDRFRFLRMRLRDLRHADYFNRLLITSPLPGDGKSTIATNLATALAESREQTVLLIDADLHRSSLSTVLGVKPRPGVAEYLEGSAGAMSSLVRLEPLGWYLLQAGERPADPTELLQRASLPRMIEELSPHFDWIVVDAPPVLPITDALALSRQLSKSLVVARAGRTPVDAIEKTIGLLGKRNVIGVVLNDVEPDSRRLYSAYRKYYVGGDAQDSSTD